MCTERIYVGVHACMCGWPGEGLQISFCSYGSIRIKFRVHVYIYI